MAPRRASAAAGEILLAAPLVVLAAARVARLERVGRDAALPQLLTAVRRAPRLPRPLARPDRLAGAVTRLLPWLPPAGMRVCLKQSLILLDLWARCGLQGRLHLGLACGPRAGGRGHVWATAPGLAAAPPGYLEIWSG